MVVAGRFDFCGIYLTRSSYRFCSRQKSRTDYPVNGCCFRNIDWYCGTLFEIKIDTQYGLENTVPNKPIAYMAADANTLTPVLWKNSSDYPQYSLLDTATNAIAKTLAATL